ncbi:hypothetical protein M3210_10655 [Oceanobacillus luteolus]|uniref:DUF4367 domain-containing protein n=1 Tax=Oceanobacillus luteolus TaxID=1274358 RepID=A0ABW4HM66_9BACI|nr:hypothetical protein [Oceanobacillus luteolus]MCM3740733.1 hypothetical protein [Oceanobacillus luteolus]
MNNKELDNKIKEILSKQPNERDIAKMEDDIWKSLDDQLPRKKRGRVMKKISIGLSVAAVLFIGFIIFSASNSPENAMVQSVRKIFVEDKKEIIEIEGQEEEIDVHYEPNQELNYSIYIDESRYKMVKGEAYDRIEMKEPVGGDFPEVYMEIRKVENTTTEAVVQAIKEGIETSETMGIRSEERVSEPIEAEMIQGMGLDGSGDPDSFGWESTTPIHRYYVTDAQNEQVYVIKQVYFLEAAEGHGARFHHMLESFELLEEE